KAKQRLPTFPPPGPRSVEENALLVEETRRRIPGLTLVEREFTVPLDHDHPAGETLTVFAREVVGNAPGAHDFPFLVFFQGGPGHEAPRPLAEPASHAWLARALSEYRVLLLDQRGTGRSTPVGS